MPEYLAPGVYVEEIELGAKPIEGVSTSTTGFVGVAQRGPVNRPVLVTNFGEYRRFFGSYLGEQTYRARRWLPYAVDGFFANGGKRAYIVRVAKLTQAPGEPPNTPVATVAQAVLPDRSDAARRTLSRPVRTGEQEIDLTYWAGLSVGDVLQLDDGARAEYVHITGFTNRIQVTPALIRGHNAGVTVMQVSGALTTLARPPANSAGAPNIRVADRNAAGLAASVWVAIDDGTNTEFVRLVTGPGAAGEGDIDVTPTLRFSHDRDRNVIRSTLPETTLASGVNANDPTIRLTARTGFNDNDWVLLRGNVAGEDEAVRLGVIPAAAPFNVPVTPTPRFPHSNGRNVTRLTMDPTPATTLADPIIRLTATGGLNANDLVLLEGDVAGQDEAVRLGAIPAVAPFDVPVTPTPRFPHSNGRNVTLLTLAAAPATTLASGVNANDPSIRLTATGGLNANDLVLLEGDVAGQDEAVRLGAIPAVAPFDVPVTPTPRFPHSNGRNVTLLTLAAAPATTLAAPIIRLTATAILNANDLVLLEGDVAGEDEAVRLGAIPAVAPFDVPVTQTPRFAHSSGRNVTRLTPSETTTLANNVNASDSTIRLTARTGFNDNDWVLLRGNAAGEDEAVRLGAIPAAAPFNVPVTPTPRFPHDSGRNVTRLTLATAPATNLVAPTSIRLQAAAGLAANNVVMIEDSASTEFVQLAAAPDANMDASLISPLRFSHTAGRNIQRVTTPGVTTPEPTTLNAAADPNATPPTISVAARDNLTSGTVVEILDGAQTEYAQVVTSEAGPGNVALLRPLRYPHPTATPVRALQGTLRVTAGPSQPDLSLYPEVGEWGNNICIQVESACITRAEVTQPASVGDPALTLSTTQGIEVGSVVRLPGNRYATVTSAQGNRIFLQGDVPAAITQTDVEGDNVWMKQVMTCEFTMRFSYTGTEEEVRTNLSMDSRHSRYFVKVINETEPSRLVHVEALTNNATAPLNQPLTTSEWYPGGGNDLLSGIDAGVYMGSNSDDADRRTGLFALLNRTDVSIVAVPGQTDQTVQLALINHAERARYRFAVLDSEERADLDGVQTQRNRLDSKYAALYYPWIQIFDPLEKNNVFAPPSGHVCGIYARTDTEVGVHKAPANAVVSQVLDLRFTITQGQQDILNPKGINAIRYFPGRGIRVWGARTISSDTAWRYINVRRLFIYLERSIDESTQYAVFEPNDVPLWERLRGSVTAFLTTQWRAGMFQGKTPNEAFFVKVGLGETMTQDDIDNGRVIMLIGVAPVKPAEFVIFRITQMPRGPEVAE